MREPLVRARCGGAWISVWTHASARGTLASSGGVERDGVREAL